MPLKSDDKDESAELAADGTSDEDALNLLRTGAMTAVNAMIRSRER